MINRFKYNCISIGILTCAKIRLFHVITKNILISTGIKKSNQMVLPTSNTLKLEDQGNSNKHIQKAIEERAAIIQVIRRFLNRA